MSIDFSKVSEPVRGSYLQPGMYRLKIDPTGTKLVTVEGKNSYVLVKFVDENGSSLNEKFYLTEKALDRLKYLHRAWFGKTLEKEFNSFNEVGDYFVKALTAKSVVKPMLTGGKLTPDGKFYAGLPYDGFVIADESKFVEGEFEEGSARYNQVVRKEKPNPLVASTDSVLLPSTDGEDSPWS